MTSAKDIIIEAAAPPTSVTLGRDASPDDVNAIFRRLRELLNSIPKGTSKHDLAAIPISACIDAGIDTGKRITGAAHRLGFNSQHAGIVLQEGIGRRWVRDETGKYQNLI